MWNGANLSIIMQPWSGVSVGLVHKCKESSLKKVRQAEKVGFIDFEMLGTLK